MSNSYADLQVLIVEDESFIQVLLKSILQQLGFRADHIYLSSDGSEALVVLRARRVDFIICDWFMDPMDGPSFVQILRDPEKTPAPGVPVILCSGKLDRVSIADILDAGVNEAIVKPITIGAVESRIQSILKKPRSVISNKSYIGPERRRIDDGDHPEERRHQPREYVVDC